ncbi:hypothetical protein ACH4F6_09150 [Streptomyces sp. NPDC017936]|uniref:hypothetical protein n=1 Tax=Streptomyces sp. NPDC017936 TaxID=3365016 RepID=UPI0037A5F666
MHDRVHDLATALSVAVRIEPELIRAVRLALFPRYGVETESALWFSGLVRSRGPRGIVLDTAERRELQRLLGHRLTRRPPEDPVHSLWDVVARVHADLSPALLLEERVTWLALAGRTDEAEDALAPVLKAVTVEGRDGLRRWFAAAWERLPAAVRESGTAWQLAQVARPHFPRGRFPLDTVQAPVTNGLLGDLARCLDDIRITVRRDGGGLEVDGTPVDPDARAAVRPHTYALTVPDTAPRTLTVLGGGPRGTDREVSVPVNRRVRVPVGAGPLQVRNARGEVFLVPAQATVARSTELRGRFLGVTVGGYAGGPGALPEAAAEAREVGNALAEHYTLEYLDDPTLQTLQYLPARLRPGPADPPDGPLVVYYRGPAVLRGDGEELLLAVRDSDPRVPATHLGARDLYAACVRSGASQVLIVLDLSWNTLGGPSASFSAPADVPGAAEWAGHVVTTAFPGSSPHRSLGGWLIRMLHRGPSTPPEPGWEPRRRFVTGADLLEVAASGGLGGARAVGAYGTPGPLLPNPRYALRRFPDDVDPAGFGEAYAAEAGAFLREVIAEPETPSGQRDRAVTNMGLLGTEHAIGAGRALHRLAERHAGAGRREEALAAAESAVEVLTPFTDREPAAALPALGQALDGLADRLAELDRPRDALARAEESAAAWRLAVRHSAANSPGCASSLCRLAGLLLGAERAEDALAVALEGVRLCRDLITFDQNAFRSGLARSLAVLSRVHVALGGHREARDATAEAVHVLREQAEESGAAPSEELVRGLRELWRLERRLGQNGAALRAIVEYTERRRLERDETERSRQLLADAFDCLAVSHGDAGQFRQAVWSSREAVTLYSGLTDGSSAADHRPALALSLRNLSVWLTSDRPVQLPEALAALHRAVGLYRQLEAERPGRREADLAATLEGTAHWLREAGELAQAVDALGEAVRIYRGLTARNRSAHRLSLARSLNSLSVCLDALGRRGEARRMRDEVKSLILNRPDGGPR